jgi:SAM-dependent methyltransferase
MCPICRSLERHRFAWLVLDRVGQHYLSGRSVTRLLHIAPEPFLETRFRSEERIDYLSADLRDRCAMEWFDVTRIPHPDRSFDLVFCCHVLEHVTDDRQALFEFHRVLDSGGSALIMVPLREGATIEAPPGMTRQQRQALLGHPDHLRLYGPDIAGRLEEVGFRVNRTSSDDLVGAAKVRLVSVPGQSVFEARKPV